MSFYLLSTTLAYTWDAVILRAKPLLCCLVRNAQLQLLPIQTEQATNTPHILIKIQMSGTIPLEYPLALW